MQQETRNVSDLRWREDLYPRLQPDPATIQRYAVNLDVLPPVEVNQHNDIIDGYHRWTAHKLAGVSTLPVVVTQTDSDLALLALACERNAAHGLQLSEPDKRSMALRLFNSGAGLDKPAIAKALSVTLRSVNGYLTDVERRLREERKQRIFDMWLACATQQEIADACGISIGEVNADTKDCSELEALPKLNKLSALYQDDFTPELYDIWTFAKKTNEVSHFGNTEQRILDNLLYALTQPFDVVVDPFAGGGSTIDVCKKRLRRYWVSDRKPTPARTDIRQTELAADKIAGPYHWQDVALVYLDPPYWRQAQGQYSSDAQDLANMPIEQFTGVLVGIIQSYLAKLRTGAHLACIIQPTQWLADDKQTAFHDLDLARLVNRGRLVHRIVCPYSTQQYNAQQVEWAKENKTWLVLSRTMLVWEK